ncbi:hypothetical protein Moror_9936 [Moniliophthora roreri MCA 2997]|uniref:Uncharacterized protein n=1 Tax=Moniliophthora roreri (strain MCA 2997) TaxID=1381753 RepID=V2WVS1_MONRO|nr:hypothetical protein Moror_9936 [Moniliophthora roreri MCA 2997]
MVLGWLRAQKGGLMYAIFFKQGISALASIIDQLAGRPKKHGRTFKPQPGLFHSRSQCVDDTPDLHSPSSTPPGGIEVQTG